MVMIEFFAEKNSIFSDRYPRVIPEAVWVTFEDDCIDKYEI
jgi:hypothetical protein